MEELSKLYHFCNYIVRRHYSPDRLSVEELAEEFRNKFFGALPINGTNLRALAEHCGIRLTPQRMPANLRGYSEAIDNRMSIYYKEDDCESGFANTVPHEMRELMEPIFVTLCLKYGHDYTPLKTTALHLAANRFAAAFLLPRKEYRQKLYETGLDLLALRDFYQKSYSQLLIRIGEVLEGEMFFYGALYELVPRADGLGLELAVTYWKVSPGNQDSELNFYLPANFFPKKGHRVTSGSLVDEVARWWVPHLVNIDLSHEPGEEGPVALARPIMRGDEVMKIVLIMMLEQDRQIIDPQIKRAKPVILEPFFRHL